MIVCVCNAIRERDIRRVAQTGLTDVEDIYAELGHEPNCCQCLPFAEQIIREVRCTRRPEDSASGLANLAARAMTPAAGGNCHDR